MKRSFLTMAILASVISLVAVGWYINHQYTPPSNRDAMNADFDQEVLAYLVVDRTPFVLVEWGNQLIWEDLEVPWKPTPQWVWDGNWTVVQPTNNLGSAQLVDANGKPVFVGEIRDNAIVSARIELRNGQLINANIDAPGYAILLPENTTQTDVRQVDLMDAAGNIIWSSVP